MDEQSYEYLEELLEKHPSAEEEIRNGLFTADVLIMEYRDHCYELESLEEFARCILQEASPLRYAVCAHILEHERPALHDYLQSNGIFSGRQQP